MKKLIVFGLLVTITLFGCSNEKTVTNKQDIENFVKTYLEALETKGVSSTIKYADDLRFPNKENQKEEYSIIFAEQDVTDSKIVNIKKVSENLFEATIEFVESGDFATHTFPVKQKDEEWRIIVGQDS
ncbi:hypothetical protein AB1K32_08615 [Metabacillus dongyingensis]|uniref:hypothetical protein n=1 Tax=Metabacillus dongyingensis TaxID=2874282 RepID=UPI003B8DE61D